MIFGRPFFPSWFMLTETNERNGKKKGRNIPIEFVKKSIKCLGLKYL